jgi:hypothetical protein
MHESDVWALFVKIGFLIEVKFLFVSRPKTRARPTEERFLLRVDGQIKRSFSSKEDAATAGAVIKKAYPIVVVTVVDTEKHTTEIINA